jgi:carboxylesterase
MALAEAGFTSAGIRLPGHGTTPEDLAGRRYEEWLRAVEDGFHMLAGKNLRVYGIGMSTGGLLLLASRLPMAGLVLLSPYLRLRHPLAPAAGFLRFLRRYHRQEVPPGLASYYYDRRPVNGVHQIFRLVRRVRKELGSIDAPVLMINAAGDTTIHIDSALDLFRRLPSPRKEFHLFGPEVPHVLTTEENPRRRETFRLTVDFLRGLEEDRNDP